MYFRLKVLRNRDPAPCPICYRTYERLDSVFRHLQTAHQDFINDLNTKLSPEVDVIRYLRNILKSGDISNEIFKSFKDKSQLLNKKTKIKDIKDFFPQSKS